MENKARKIHYPSTVRLDEGDLKEIAEWRVGKTYTVILKVKMVAAGQGDSSGLVPYNDEDYKRIHAKFEILSAKAPEKEERTYEHEAIEHARREKS